MCRVHWWSRAALAVLVVSGLVGLTSLTVSRTLTATGAVLRLWQHDALAFDDLVVCCALIVLAATFGWLALGALLTLGTQALRCTHTAAGRLVRRMTPSLLRRLVAGACGAAVLAAPAVTPPATSASADHAHVRPAGHPAGATSPRPGALPVPDRPTRAAHRVSHRTPRVRVHPGDTLWAIAARRLPPGASDADICASWPRWFRHNRRLIGPDPDLIRPWTRLRVPPRPH